MPILDVDAVKSGKVTPQPGDFVNGFEYVGGPVQAASSWQILSGKDYLDSIPPIRAKMALAVIEGRAPLPPLARQYKGSGPQPANVLRQDATAADPGFDATEWARRSKAINDFSSGKTAALIQALNQAPLHMLTLANAYDQLHNFSGPETVNNILTKTQAAMGDTKQQGAMGEFNAVQPAVADEAATIYKGGPATIPDIANQQAAFPMGAAPTTSNSALSAASELMMDRLNTLETRWSNAMGPNVPMFPVISPKARTALYTLYARYHPGWTPDQGTASSQPLPLGTTGLGTQPPAPKPQTLPNGQPPAPQKPRGPVDWQTYFGKPQ